MQNNCPITEEVKSSKKHIGIPLVADLHYDLWTLKIKLEFLNSDFPVYAIFKNIQGFRVLDEGYLTEYWNDEKRSQGWLWKVKEDGWYDQERTRSGFPIGAHTLQNYDEYMIVGQNDCLNVICGEEPIILVV